MLVFLGFIFVSLAGVLAFKRDALFRLSSPLSAFEKAFSLPIKMVGFFSLLLPFYVFYFGATMVHFIVFIDCSLAAFLFFLYSLGFKYRPNADGSYPYVVVDVVPKDDGNENFCWTDGLFKSEFDQLGGL